MMKLTLGELLASGQWTSFPDFGSESKFTFIFTSAQARAAFQKKFAHVEVESPDGTIKSLDAGTTSKNETSFVLTFTWNQDAQLRAQIIEVYKKHVDPGVGVGPGWFTSRGHIKRELRADVEAVLKEMRADGTCNFRKPWYYLAEMDDHHEDRYNGAPT